MTDLVPYILERGYISCRYNFNDTPFKVQPLTPDGYVAKISALFLPFVRKSITDGEYISIQNKLTEIIHEIKGGKKC